MKKVFAALALVAAGLLASTLATFLASSLH
jgi:hypothetical protein